MKTTHAFEFPEDREAVFKRARRLEWFTLAYIASSATLLYFVMGSSQAMRATFFEEVISTVPSLAFLIGSWIARWPPSPRFPYGLHGAVSIGYFAASLALIGMGGFILIESVMKLLSGERTTIGGVTLFGETVWAGWPMLAAVAYAGLPAAFIGRMKMRLAPQIHDKVLYADANMMKADWMTEAATAAAIIGIGFGFWWLDAVAAGLIALDILKDGFTNTWVAISDLIERRPMKTDRSKDEPLPDEIKRFLKSLNWVSDVEVRLRETGHVFFGEAYVVPKTTEDVVNNIRRATDGAKRLNWRLHDLVITLVDRLDEKSR